MPSICLMSFQGIWLAKSPVFLFRRKSSRFNRDPPGERPVVLLSAGIGATPVLAMLYALAAARSTQQMLWLHATRDRQHHPFASEVRRLMLALTHGRSFVCYSRPGSREKMGEDFDTTGHLSRSVFEEVGVPRIGIRLRLRRQPQPPPASFYVHRFPLYDTA